MKNDALPFSDRLRRDSSANVESRNDNGLRRRLVRERRDLRLFAGTGVDPLTSPRSLDFGLVRKITRVSLLMDNPSQSGTFDNGEQTGGILTLSAFRSRRIVVSLPLTPSKCSRLSPAWSATTGGSYVPFESRRSRYPKPYTV